MKLGKVKLRVRAGRYVGINRTGAIALKYRDAISKKYNKTDYRNIAIKSQISQYFLSGTSKIHEISREISIY